MGGKPSYLKWILILADDRPVVRRSGFNVELNNPQMQWLRWSGQNWRKKEKKKKGPAELNLLSWAWNYRYLRKEASARHGCFPWSYLCWELETCPSHRLPDLSLVRTPQPGSRSSWCQRTGNMREETALTLHLSQVALCAPELIKPHNWLPSGPSASYSAPQFSLL